MSCVVLFTIGLCITRYVHAGDLSVYVNRIEFRYTITDNRRFDDKYSYFDGDMVDVCCVRVTTNCDLQLHYDFTEEHVGGKGYVAEVSNHSIEKFNGIGLRTVLRAAHNHKHIICECTNTAFRTTIDIQLVLDDSFSGMKLNINGFLLRYQRSINKLTTYVNIEIYYIMNEQLRFEYERNKKIEVKTQYKEKCQRFNKSTVIDVIPDVDCYINYKTYNSSIIFPTVAFRFKPFMGHLYDYPQLTRIPNDSLLQLYGFKKLEYYKYEIDKNLSLICNSNSGHQTSPRATIVKYNNCFVKQIQTSLSPNNKTTNSYLSNKDNTTDGQIKHAASSQDSEFPYEILVAALGALCFIVIAVTTAVCFLKRRNHRLLGEEETQLGNSPTPPYRQKQSHYSIPPHQKYNKVIYSELRTRSSKTPLRVPSPVCTTEEEGPSSEITYAVLDLSPFSQVPNNLVTESPYAEVLCGVSPRRCPSDNK